MKAMRKLGVHLPGYLAVVVQDIDSMGRFLSSDAPDAGGGKIMVSPGEHRRLSTALLSVATAQWEALRSSELLGVPVYAGGDDLLTFVPAASALAAAQECQRALPLSLPRASTAVVYFHYYGSIQAAITEAQRLLKAAKGEVPGKHGLAVGYVRRSGASAVSVQPWAGPDGGSSAGLFGLFARERAGQLSPRLVADLRRDAGELAALAEVSERLYRAELARLVRRHSEDSDDRTVAAQVAGALEWLGSHEHAPGEVPGPHAAAQVGVFLRQEAR
jgi:CRISPR-associated protein Cmr2